jgi:hypothetical protein
MCGSIFDVVIVKLHYALVLYFKGHFVFLSLIVVLKADFAFDWR